jgi:hypothetical protein
MMEALNAYDVKERRSVVVLELCTYSTEDQQVKTFEKFKKEMELQGFRVVIRDVKHW